jgi:DNA polymerase I
VTTLVFDTEANGLLDTVTKAHCVCAIILETGAEVIFGPDQIKDGLTLLSQADVLIGHNILRYDLPMLKKVYGWEPSPETKIRDTKVIARLKHPNVMETDAKYINRGIMPPGKDYRGKHTIAAWGYRLGVKKEHEDITDWSTYTEDMGTRCLSDVRVNAAIWKFLCPERYSQQAIELEQDVDVVVWRMEQCGVPFSREKAGALHVELLAKKDEIEHRLKSQFGFWYAPCTPDPRKSVVRPKVPRRVTDKKTGQRYRVEGPYTKLKLVKFNPKSRPHIERVLRKMGWKPTKFTQSGRAEIDEQVVEDICAKFPAMAGLGEYMMVQKRLSQLVDGNQSLLNNVGADGCIHGVINPMGTGTSRASHFGPNLAQVPSAKKPYGDRFRGLFEVPDGWDLVGADQEGLEGRGLGHYMAAFDGGAYAKVLLEGDPHWRSTIALGFVPPAAIRDKHNQFHVICREGSKRFYYAFVYGAREGKCGEIILAVCLDALKAGFPELLDDFFDGKHPSKDKQRAIGGKARVKFMDGIPGMEKLQEAVADQVSKFNAVRGLDGRVIPCRSPHSALNFLIQSAGAIICKRWLVDAYKELLARGYKHGWDGDFVFCLWVHDEIQVACRHGLGDEIGQVLVEKAKAAGVQYGFRIPLDSKYDIGRSWADTH